MDTVLDINRKHEKIRVEEGGRTVLEWRIATDDKSIEDMIAKIGNAVDRAHILVEKEAEAETDEERREANDMIVRLQKRVITAIIGADGYRDVLTYIGDGEPCDPSENIRNIGEVFAALCVWLYERCTSKQLREMGVYFQREDDRMGGKWVPDNRASRRAKGKKRK